MQTNFTSEQLADPDVAASEKILRACVHCGFCTATCPTYVLLGDELDSPRGRIYLIKQMLEEGKPATREVTTHLDRCLSCLSCMTTCPSGVHYQHLIDHARAHVEETYQRPFHDRALRAVLAFVLPYPKRFRVALLGAALARPFRFLLPKGRLRAMLDLARDVPGPGAADRDGVFPAQGKRVARVALLAGCAQRVLAPSINAATIRLLNRHGVEVVVTGGCCGALPHHLGKVDPSHDLAAHLIRQFTAEIDGAGLDAIVVNASGCGTQVKDYGWMFRNDPHLAADAARVSALARDVTEFVTTLNLPAPAQGSRLVVAYHSACSMQHGQKITHLPKALLQAAGFTVREPLDAHLCCGSAGTYNLLQPEISSQLKARKASTLVATGADVMATGNIGCMTQLADAVGMPVVHTVELLDWATGGPKPDALR
ncbi:glycolate oxidase subunit GlcF [Roseiterribacter gracilis]|uniref:Glycolate oxidase iron-sulfur subunit n=1 Tax=Roseiterribacter gracilis TaxID=2812848 RepID=A0A8S8XC53_9PROT|nr:glycolate oxidase iron-sulfur subunit [Rhodospirillales bacterium TMPK1]